MVIDAKSLALLLQNCKSFTQLKQIHAQIFRAGLHDHRGTLNKLIVSATNPSFTNIRYAAKVFNYVKQPHLFLYNVMIKAFTKLGRFKDSIFLFNELRRIGLEPDNFTYPFVFKAIGSLNDVLNGGMLHCVVVKTGLVLDGYVCNSLMDMYAQLDRICVSKKVFDEMRDRDVVSWNVLISNYVKSRRFVDALDVFRAMRKERGLLPDEGTIVSTLSACSATKNLELGEEIHRYVRDEFGYTDIIRNALVDMYCKCGCLDKAEEIFDVSYQNVICWTTMVSGYVNCGELKKARGLFDRCPVKDVVLWTAMINGYVQFKRFDDAVALFREMQIAGVKPDKFIIVTLLTGCAQTGALELGKWIHGYMNDNHIRIDAFTGTALIELYAKCGNINKALEIFYGLKERDTASWTSIVCGLANNGKTSQALSLFSEMKLTRLKPDDVTFIGVLSACSHGGLVAGGLEVFNSMVSVYHIEPKLEHYGCLIDLFGRAGLLNEAEEMLKKVPHTDTQNIIPLYGSLLSACRTYKNLEMGERVARELMKLQSCDSSIVTLMTDIYASAERWEDVKKVRAKMKDDGVRKIPGCSSIEVDGITHEFIVGDPSHPRMREIYSMLDKVSISL